MFRGLSKALDRKEKSLIRSNSNNVNINRAFTRFLDEFFPEGKGLIFDIIYNSLNNQVTIQTPNKIVANELILTIRDLSKVFKEEGVKSDQIIIR